MLSKSHISAIIFLFIIFISSVVYCSTTTQISKGDYSTNIINSGILIYSNQSQSESTIQNLSIQYMRAFDSKKVPLFMKYIISKNTTGTRLNASKEFQEFWHEKWKKPLLPLTNDLNWNYIIDNFENLDKIYNEQSNNIGFLFMIIENKSEYPIFDINLEYLVYEKNFVINDKMNISGKPEERNIAYLNSGEAFIMLLGAYKSKLDGMPEYYLSYFQRPLSLRYILNRKTIRQSIREPYGLKAARILLPQNWMSMHGWMGQ